MKDNGNAAIRETICSEIYELGVREKKKQVLNYLGKELAKLHEECFLHIHDLDTFGEIYNCSTPNLKQFCQRYLVRDCDYHCFIFDLFSIQKKMITELGMNQSGGIGINDYDVVISEILLENSIELNDETESVMRHCLREFLFWINTNRTRCCREPYYITINIGMAITEWGRKISDLLLKEFMLMPMKYTRPNIVFKVKGDLHLDKEAINRDLFLNALECTGQRMIPTYLLMDSKVNREYSPKSIGIMGCRTRVAANVNGESGTSGRGNIGNVSINLPRLALISNSEKDFFENLFVMMNNAYKILKKREDFLLESKGKYVEYVLTERLWDNVLSVEDMVMQGTFSIGYIGLSEAIEILTVKKFYCDSEAYDIAMKIVETMREYVDRLSFRQGRNYSLLASPGELISGRFCEYDRKLYKNKVLEKGYYTNSFHVDVDAGVPVFAKIDKEAAFHALNNGGCISYVEFKEAVVGNSLAIEDIMLYAIEKDISYLGINFPLDICRDCGLVGTFDRCVKCDSDNIKRVRRVSGYLEDVKYFTSGKKAEEKNRKSNVR